MESNAAILRTTNQMWITRVYWSSTHYIPLLRLMNSCFTKLCRLLSLYGNCIGLSSAHLKRQKRRSHHRMKGKSTVESCWIHIYIMEKKHIETCSLFLTDPVSQCQIPYSRNFRESRFSAGLWWRRPLVIQLGPAAPWPPFPSPPPEVSSSEEIFPNLCVVPVKVSCF